MALRIRSSQGKLRTVFHCAAKHQGTSLNDVVNQGTDLTNKLTGVETIPACERAKGLQELDLSKESLPAERALGICWIVDTDYLRFKTNIKNRPATKRGMLSVVSAIYDPLGLLSSCILRAKLIMQDLCRKKNLVGTSRCHLLNCICGNNG
jgi:hypothetical protein